MSRPGEKASTDSGGRNAATIPNSRHNYRVLVGDVACFFIGVSFLDSATALPALLRQLGGGAVFLGTLLALRQAAYYFPQLVVAHLVEGRSHYKHFLLTIVGLGRIWFLPAAAGVYFLGKDHPRTALLFLAFAYTMSWIGDGAGGVPWTSLVGRMIPDQQRGRLFATTQIISGFSRFGVSAVVITLLGGKTVSFPLSGALQVLFCAVFLGFSWCFLATLRETPTARNAAEVPTFSAYLRALPSKFRARPDFMGLALVQILATVSVACAPFLVGYAPKVLGHSTFALNGWLGMVLGNGLPGVFLAAQTLGLLIFAPVWGSITDRTGPRASLRGVFIVAMFCPLLAICAGLSPSVLRLPLLLAAYFCFGAVQDAWIVITNYLLDATPQPEQPVYVGLMNTATLPALLLPFGAGILVQTLGEKSLWGASLISLGIGWWIATKLPDTRAVQQQGKTSTG